MATLSNGVFIPIDQILNSVLVSLNLSATFISDMFDKSSVNQSPCILNFNGFHIIFKWGKHFILELLFFVFGLFVLFCFFLNHTSQVFS